ncbi:copper amine oxidase N-terminal domain-containing protein [Paenibacillus pseudetheri]|uniref:Copper amine oxidase-like N-terminal domain-containing protein n=1 Tax=Paenibacillus pseudetheri TaxID=2897682 RepID=A0ABM9BA54_9BACL|nr:copper amine oxidase N-terminal domain-containing protein [Paenibacillus pseudetheri]CAH1055564.1 hypothetical protein PAECIP111894_01716 [Paenibacillus pseudetheri]
MKAIKWSIAAVLAVSMYGPIHTVKAADANSTNVVNEQSNSSTEDLIFQMDYTEMTVGDKVPVQIFAKGPDGSSERVPLSQADMVIEKPYLLQKLPDGSIKALAVGETKVTVRSGSASKTLSVSISADKYIDKAVIISGTMYLPVQSVFKSLGASVQANTATKTFSIRLGDLPIQLQLGSDIAMVNGNKVKMNGKVQTVDGVAVFPSTLLKTALGAVLDFTGPYETMNIYFGKAELFAHTKNTFNILKKQSQGDLAKLIGKTYWFNQFDSDYKFQKATIVDILVNDDNEFAISFQLSSGKVVNTYDMEYDQVTRVLGTKEYFFTSDPTKIYKWSNATWAKIKAGTISTGMTKQQVELSWGTPVNKSSLSGSGIKVETWQYENYNYVTFTNGVVSMIYTN